jgi:hypothetical protein
MRWTSARLRNLVPQLRKVLGRINDYVSMQQVVLLGASGANAGQVKG